MATVRTPETSPFAEVFETEVVRRNLDRVRRGMDVILDRESPVVGATPKDILYAKGTQRLYRYRPVTDEEYLLREGFDVFMVDWGVPRPEDSHLGLEYYVLDALPRNVEEVQKVTGEREINILGYCMGGLLGLMYNGIFHDAPVANMVCAATPVDFDGMGLFRRWSDRRWFDLDRLVDSLGNIPPDLIFRSFEMLRPAQRWAEYARLL